MEDGRDDDIPLLATWGGAEEKNRPHHPTNSLSSFMVSHVPELVPTELEEALEPPLRHTQQATVQFGQSYIQDFRPEAHDACDGRVGNGQDPDKCDSDQNLDSAPDGTSSARSVQSLVVVAGKAASTAGRRVRNLDHVLAGNPIGALVAVLMNEDLKAETSNGTDCDSGLGPNCEACQLVGHEAVSDKSRIDRSFHRARPSPGGGIASIARATEGVGGALVDEHANLPPLRGCRWSPHLSSTLMPTLVVGGVTDIGATGALYPWVSSASRLGGRRVRSGGDLEVDGRLLEEPALEFRSLLTVEQQTLESSIPFSFPVPDIRVIHTILLSGRKAISQTFNAVTNSLSSESIPRGATLSNMKPVVSMGESPRGSPWVRSPQGSPWGSNSSSRSLFGSYQAPPRASSLEAQTPPDRSWLQALDGGVLEALHG
ncbi:hypothetical protein V8F20_004019 [Naviculisporaceae sp. PSN 640]